MPFFMSVQSILWLWIWLTPFQSPSASQQAPVMLAAGQVIEQALAPGETHAYQITLAADQYLEVVIEQRRVDVAATLFGPDGNKLGEVNRARGSKGAETLTFVAAVAGNYRVEIRPAEKNAMPGQYAAKISALRNATAVERTLEEARRLAEEARSLRQKGKYDDALTPATRTLTIREQVLGPNHLAVAEALYGLASIYDDKENYEKAEPLFQRALTIREQGLSPAHSEYMDVARSLRSLAWIYGVRQDFARAEAFYQRALSIQEQALGTEHSEVATTLNDLALLFNGKGDYDQAILVNQRVLLIREKTAGPESEATATALSNLALAHREKGNYVQSELLLRRALPISEKARGPQHPQTAFAVENLAQACAGLGNYAEAESLYQRALAIREQAFGPTHNQVARTLHNLAVLYRDRGDYEQSRALFQRAIAIYEKVFGPDHPYVATSLSQLANIYLSEADYAQAEPLLHRALAIREKALGPQHPQVATSLHQLGQFYRLTKRDYTQTESYIRRALVIYEKVFGADQYPLTSVLGNLAALYESQADYAQATQFYQRTLVIQEQALGPEHSEVAQTLASLARLARARQDTEQALVWLNRAHEVRERNFNLNLQLGSERQKLDYLKLYAADTDHALSLHTQFAPHNPQALRLAFTTLLRRKGRGLDALSNNIATLRSRALPQDQALFTQLATARAQWAALTFKEPGKDTASYRARLKQLEAETERLEVELGSRSAEFRAQSRPITLEAVQATLPQGATLVEFALYRPDDGPAERPTPPRYVAYLLNAQGQAQWADLGAAAGLDAAINVWRAALRDPKRTDTNKLGRVVSALLLQPLQPLLAGAQHLLISPDGALNLIPFEALPTATRKNLAEQYLVERYAISYLTSGRDLLRLQQNLSSVRAETSAPNVPLVIADPLFGEPGALANPPAQTIAQAGRLSRRRSVTTGNALNEVYFAPLFGTAQEARAIKTLFSNATLLTGAYATEAALKQVNAPRLLHLATHGFFLADTVSQPTAKVNPLLRSGLALAQANLRQQLTTSPATGEDGILTALEAAGLNLWGTRLVTLSACDTGLGEVRNGEGVYGLRRAFALAGAETLVMSLWPVSDQVTRELMAAYYTGLQRGQGRSAALRAAQLQMLKQPQRRAPYYWASFIQAGEWGNLNGQR